MPANDPEYQRRYHQSHYAANKQAYKDQASARKAALKAEVNRLKQVPCADCDGRFGYWVMQFDHRPGCTKDDDVSRLLARGVSRRRILDEIAKCDVVCANCHADREHERRVQASMVSTAA